MRRLGAVVLVLAITLGACASEADPPSGRATGSVIDGSVAALARTLRSMRGKPVVVNYWATWCEPCKAEMPRIVAAYRRYRDRVRFLGVNVEDGREAAQSFVSRYGVPFRSLALSISDVRRDQDILGLPVTQFYRTDGELAFVHQGEIRDDDLKEKIEDLLNVGRPPARPSA